MAPKCKSSDAAIQIYKVFPLSENMKVLYLIKEKKKKTYAEVAKI